MSYKIIVKFNELQYVRQLASKMRHSLLVMESLCWGKSINLPFFFFFFWSCLVLVQELERTGGLNLGMEEL